MGNNSNVYPGLISTIIFLIITLLSCRKFVEVPAPLNSINANNVFENDKTAIQALTSVYASMADDNARFLEQSYSSIFLFGGLSADEFTLYDKNYPLYSAYYRNALSQGSNGVLVGSTFWSGTFSLIFRINSTVEGLEKSTGLSPIVKRQLQGEALFLRAYSYFLLVNLYGDTPISLTTDPAKNRLLARSPKADVYTQIVNDLLQSQQLLSDNYLDADLKSSKNSTGRVRPTKWAATALLSRAYLYMGRYPDAIIQSESVINNSSLFKLEPLNSVFLNKSLETIWCLQPIVAGGGSGYNTGESSIFILSANGPTSSSTIGIGSTPFYLSDSILGAFEPGDARRSDWIGKITANGIDYFFPYKYKAPKSQTANTESQVLFRLAEQYLIRAEAKARHADLSGALSDLNVLRSRARATPSVLVPNPLPNLIVGMSLIDVLKAIEHERQIELFAENGHRWFDLKRTPGFTNPQISRADEIMPTITSNKGGIWNSNWKLYPLPSADLFADPNLINTQNPGY